MKAGDEGDHRRDAVVRRREQSQGRSGREVAEYADDGRIQSGRSWRFEPRTSYASCAGACFIPPPLSRLGVVQMRSMHLFKVSMHAQSDGISGM